MFLGKKEELMKKALYEELLKRLTRDSFDRLSAANYGRRLRESSKRAWVRRLVYKLSEGVKVGYRSFIVPLLDNIRMEKKMAQNSDLRERSRKGKVFRGWWALAVKRRQYLERLAAGLLLMREKRLLLAMARLKRARAESCWREKCEKVEKKSERLNNLACLWEDQKSLSTHLLAQHQSLLCAKDTSLCLQIFNRVVTGFERRKMQAFGLLRTFKSTVARSAAGLSIVRRLISDSLSGPFAMLMKEGLFRREGFLTERIKQARIDREEAVTERELLNEQILNFAEEKQRFEAKAPCMKQHLRSIRERMLEKLISSKIALLNKANTTSRAFRCWRNKWKRLEALRGLFPENPGRERGGYYLRKWRLRLTTRRRKMEALSRLYALFTACEQRNKRWSWEQMEGWHCHQDRLSIKAQIAGLERVVRQIHNNCSKNRVTLLLSRLCALFSRKQVLQAGELFSLLKRQLLKARRSHTVLMLLQGARELRVKRSYFRVYRQRAEVLAKVRRLARDRQLQKMRFIMALLQVNRQVRKSERFFLSIVEEMMTKVNRQQVREGFEIVKTGCLKRQSTPRDSKCQSKETMARVHGAMKIGFVLRRVIAKRVSIYRQDFWTMCKQEKREEHKTEILKTVERLRLSRVGSVFEGLRLQMDVSKRLELTSVRSSNW